MTLTSSDLFYEDHLPGWGGSTQSLNTAWLDSLRTSPDAEHRDIDIPVALMDLVHDDLMRSGTGGGEQLSNGELRTAIRTLKVITERLEMPFKLPFYDHQGWKT